MRSFEITYREQVNDISIKIVGPGKDGSVILLLENEGNNEATRNPDRVYVLPEENHKAQNGSGRKVFFIPKECTSVSVTIGISTVVNLRGRKLLELHMESKDCHGEPCGSPKHFCC